MRFQSFCLKHCMCPRRLPSPVGIGATDLPGGAGLQPDLDVILFGNFAVITNRLPLCLKRVSRLRALFLAMAVSQRAELCARCRARNRMIS